MADFFDGVAAFFIALFAIVTVVFFLTRVGWVIMGLVCIKLLFF